MGNRYTIGRLARAAGVATSTVRYYERVRLLGPGGRTESHYRVYGDGAVERLRFIRAAQNHGFTLQDIATMLDFQDGKTAPCGEVQTLIEKRLKELDERLKQLHHLQEELQTSLGVCRRARRPAHCRVIEDLQGIARANPSEAPPGRRNPGGRSRDRS